MTLEERINNCYDNRELLKDPAYQAAINEVVGMLDQGKIRVAEHHGDDWIVNDWIKKAVLMYFPIQKMETIELGPFEFHDKIPLKKNFEAQGVRVVPHAIARHGAFLERGCIMMPSYVNIGAYAVSYTHLTLPTICSV